MYKEGGREQGDDRLSTADGSAIPADALLESRSIDWTRVVRTSYLLRQQIIYSYPAPIRDLRQRLVIVPPTRHGDQRLLRQKISILGAQANSVIPFDEFGNHVIEVTAPRVESQITFDARIVVERTPTVGPVSLPAAAARDQRLCNPSRLTQPDEHLTGIAASLARRSASPGELAQNISDWVRAEFSYEHDATGVGTTAAEALALKKGVCQDYAHVMLALCRAGGLAARYVSGHLLGEGGTHAWLDVLLPDPEHPAYVRAVPFDPTEARPPGLNYVTVAVGRDYADVAPTSGTYRASFPGVLTTQKLLGITAVEYTAA